MHYYYVLSLHYYVRISYFSFGLFEAMSAIEMMDPKMDAGMVCNQVQRDVYTLDSAVEVTIDFVTANLGDVWHGLGVGVVVVVGVWGVGKQQQERYVYNPSKCYAPYLVLCLRRLEMITMKSSFKSTGETLF